MICANCGAELKSGARFCGKCGTAVITSLGVDENLKSNDEKEWSSDPGLERSRGNNNRINQSNIKKNSISNKYFLFYIFAYNFYWLFRISSQVSGRFWSDPYAFGAGAVAIPTIAMLLFMGISNKPTRFLILLVFSFFFHIVFTGQGY